MRFFYFFSSLKFAVINLSLMMALVIIGTLIDSQIIHFGLQESVFQSFFIYWIPKDLNVKIPIFPGGYLLGGLLLINLLCSTLSNLKMFWEKLGIHLIHGGIIFLIVGETLGGIFSSETLLPIQQGTKKNYTVDFRKNELVIVCDGANDLHSESKVIEIEFPEAEMIKGNILKDIGLPFSILVKNVVKDKEDETEAQFELLDSEGKCLAGSELFIRGAKEISFEHAGHSYQFFIRPSLIRLPFWIELAAFEQERYPGTNIPKLFSSTINIYSNEGKLIRSAVISMNNPLRFNRLTFFQSGFRGDNESILKVVSNPISFSPYLFSYLIIMGFIYQFMRRFVKNKNAIKVSSGALILKKGKRHSLSRFGIFRSILFVLVPLWQMHFCYGDNVVQGIDYKALKHLPVQHGGRVKPLDSVARHALLFLHGSQNVRDSDRKLSAIEWMIDALLNFNKSKAYKIIRIENPDLLKFLGNQVDRRGYFSLEDLQPHFSKIYHLSSEILNIEEKKRDSFQKAAIVLWQQITIYLSISNTLWIAQINHIADEFYAFEKLISTGEGSQLIALDWFKERYRFLAGAAYFQLIPPGTENAQWLSMGDALVLGLEQKSIHPTASQWINSISAFQAGDAQLFNQGMHTYIRNFNSQFPQFKGKIQYEVWNNTLQPFFLAIVIYILAFLTSTLYWIWNNKKLASLSLLLLGFGFAIHTIGLISRIFIEGRPPVTNLYSSAVFVGWGAVLLSFLLEYRARSGIGCAVGSIIGAMTLLVAQHLALSGDTMEVLRAVLNSNFWLSTHVVTITLGYSATFVAGGFGIIYILRGIMTRSLDSHTESTLASTVYGIVCFSALLSFVGTVLGGFWADQSWGRFWGWDPKENGALLIILWNILILHARIGGFIKKKGLMVLVVFGNVITALSWFGVNLLQVGLHSYGFMHGTFFWLVLFAISQCLIACLGLLPKQFWRSGV